MRCFLNDPEMPPPRPCLDQHGTLWALLLPVGLIPPIATLFSPLTLVLAPLGGDPGHGLRWYSVCVCVGGGAAYSEVGESI